MQGLRRCLDVITSNVAACRAKNSTSPLLPLTSQTVTFLPFLTFSPPPCYRYAAASSTTMPASTVHLVVIHHGLWGTPANTEYLTTTLAKYHGGTISPSTKLTPPESASTIAVHAETHPNAKRHDVRMVVLNSEVNAGDHTYDGVDWCGERLVKDVYREVERLETEEEAMVGKVSLIGYSLGGLVIRYAAGLMYADGFFAGRGEGGSANGTARRTKDLPFKSRPIPASLSTIATPHLGVTLTSSTFSTVAAYVGSRNLGRSGKQLYLADRGWIPPTSSPPSDDDADSGLCLVEALSDPRFSFIAALRQFDRIDIYANAVADLTVSYRTASFSPHDPFLLAPDRISLVRNADYPALLDSYSLVSGESEKKTTWGKLATSLSPKNLPWMLNPQRFPFRFPLNYVAWVCLPVLMPVMIGLVLHKLRSDSRVSNRRVEEYERLWAVENGHLPGDEMVDDESVSTNGGKRGRKGDIKSKPIKLDKTTRGELERKRISNFLATVEAEAEETLREVGEDFVRISPSPSSTLPSTPSEDTYKIHENTPTTTPSTFPIAKDEHPLTPTQQRILANLNNPTLLPHVKKHLAHFPQVLNSHAVIIVRTASMDAHKKGMPLISAFVSRFAL